MDNSQTFDRALTRYVLEGLLDRLSRSVYRDRFVLKGAMLLLAWSDKPYRPTRDLDLLGFGDPAPDEICRIFCEICAVLVDDAVAFDLSGLTAETVGSTREYAGVRLRTTATVDRATTRVIVDIGFGDAVAPEIQEMDFPVLLGRGAPRLRTYPPEAVIAEKLHAMVVLGRANSRMKDFYDIWHLATPSRYDASRLVTAIAATFSRRRTAIPIGLPDALSSGFASDPLKLGQWDDFTRGVADRPGSLAEVVAFLRNVIMPHLKAARDLADPAGGNGG
ncbi:nucleotidyl transferase AbiEii/AbiGii toxin family protein [Rhodoplanes roseus]|uniref:nucleotidyl transferase AbiEii/AbiGii toxin family protein n=1 Tax=Rhodoplanes roseus TaxID=29409 RepID=UPI001FDFFB8A|nr:nucleotidyl transferase AbiEii/AbiGii toxin family protein [Rhodoplanes roseus]